MKVQKRVFLVISLNAFLVCLAFLSHLTPIISAFGDENISAIVKVNDSNIDYADAGNKAIEISISNTTIICTYEASKPLYVDQIAIDVYYFDLKVYSHLIGINKFLERQTQENFTLTDPLNNFTLGGIQIATGVYKLGVGLHYVVDEVPRSSTKIFYVKIVGNPLTTVLGVAIGVSTALAVYRLATTTKSTFQAFGSARSVSNSIVFPSTEIAKSSAKMTSKLTQKVSDTVQKETSNRVFTRGNGCPLCSSDWPNESETCPNCKIDVLEAGKEYGKKLEENCLRICEKLSTSVSGLRIMKIAASLGLEMSATTDCLKLLSKSGLTTIKPYTDKKLKPSTKKFIFTGLSLGISALFWFQALGIGPISIIVFVITTLLSTAIPAIASKILEQRIKSKSLI